MIKLLLIFSMFVAYNSYAASPDLTSVLNPSSTDLNLDSVNKYKASADASYNGRNSNIKNSSSVSKFNNSNGVSKNIVQANSNSSIDNLESTAGEFIQKLEDDRIKKTESHADMYNSARGNLINAYSESKKININNLGAEQDPYVQNAFKCSNLNNCNPSNENDKHAVKECTKSERLHWTGAEWQCVNLFASGGSLDCDSSKQWTKKVNNGTACVDYIYQWVKVGVEGCKSNNKAKNIYKCKRKQTPSDSGTDTSDSYCKALKPNDYSSCQYSGAWTIGSWGSCSRSCGGGSQTRSVSCKYVVCTGSKPATRRSCNTQLCTTSWRVGSWGSCSRSCGGGSQSRSVTCPSGYACTASKPSTSKSCNTHRCSSSGGSSSCSSKCQARASSRDAYNQCMRGCNGSGSSNNHCGANGCGNNGRA